MTNPPKPTLRSAAWYACFIVAIASYFALPAAAATQPPGAAARPNILLILADDLGYGDISCNGAKRIETPNIDKLAAEGRRFTSGYCSAATCTPTRYSLMTGTHAFRVPGTGVAPPNGPALIKPGTETVASLLKKGGYATAAVGKWHLGSLPQFLPTKHGFDQYYGIPYSNDMWPKHPTAKFPPLPLIEGEKVLETNPDQSRLDAWLDSKELSPTFAMGRLR